VAVIVTITVVPLEKPEDMNLILGQSHFIKTVEDLQQQTVYAVARSRRSRKTVHASLGTDSDGRRRRGNGRRYG
jgi:adenosine/AMP kinase